MVHTEAEQWWVLVRCSSVVNRRTIDIWDEYIPNKPISGYILQNIKTGQPMLQFNVHHSWPFKKKTAVKESMWLIHTFIHYHVQIVFRWYKAVVRLQCSPSCCLYCSKKRKYQHDQESRGTLANINYVLRRQADISSNVMWGEKTAQKYQWAASVSPH